MTTTSVVIFEVLLDNADLVCCLIILVCIMRCVRYRDCINGWFSFSVKSWILLLYCRPALYTVCMLAHGLILLCSFLCCSYCYIETILVLMWHWYNTWEIIIAATMFSAGNLCCAYGCSCSASWCLLRMLMVTPPDSLLIYSSSHWSW